MNLTYILVGTAAIGSVVATIAVIGYFAYLAVTGGFS